MFRWIICCLAMLALAGCRYESTADLRSSMTSYKLTAAYPEGHYVLQTRDQSNLLVLQVGAGVIAAKYQEGGNIPNNARLIALLGSDSLPERTYVAMAMGSKSETKGQNYHYYPFKFGKTHIEWLKPAQTVQIFGLADLSQHVKAADQAGGLSFQLVPEDQKQAVLARFEAWRAQTKAKAEAEAKAKANGGTANVATAPPTVQTQPTVKGFTIGDGVYVQGLFSDQPAMIRDIDQANRRVKVQRYDDGVSEWVGFDRIISRGESTANDIGRGAVALTAFACLMNPEACKKKPK